MSWNKLPAKQNWIMNLQMYESSVIAFTCLANWLDIFSICHVKKHVYSSAGENWDVYAGHRLNW